MGLGEDEDVEDGEADGEEAPEDAHGLRVPHVAGGEYRSAHHSRLDAEESKRDALLVMVDVGRAGILVFAVHGGCLLPTADCRAPK